MICMLKYVDFLCNQAPQAEIFEFQGPKVHSGIWNNHQFIEKRKKLFLLYTMQTLRSLLPLQQSQIQQFKFSPRMLHWKPKEDLFEIRFFILHITFLNTGGA